MEKAQTKTKIQQLCEFGQSVWLDNISRSIIDSGELARLIDLGVSGVTSNPTIFEKAIGSRLDYDDRIREFKNKGWDTFRIYDDLSIKDIQDAADLFLPIFQATKHFDGYVSLEVNPLLAHQTQETIKEANRLHKKVNRPNVLLKIPATKDGCEAACILISEGININFTLIFSLNQYINAVDAFIKGAAEFSQKTKDLSNIASVASVFVSRIDTSVDKLIEERFVREKDGKKKETLQNLKGSAAVINSRLIFAKYSELFSSQEFLKLKEKGLRKQRLLWASTSTKNPAYNDIKYVTELIGKETVNTMPNSTIDAFLDHGIIENALSPDIMTSQEIIAQFKDSGIDIDRVCEELLKEGVLAFEKSFNSLLKAIELKEMKLEKMKSEV